MHVVVSIWKQRRNRNWKEAKSKWERIVRFRRPIFHFGPQGFPFADGGVFFHCLAAQRDAAAAQF
jgi:hypothetical protein